jgi:hypothetical protein
MSGRDLTKVRKVLEGYKECAPQGDMSAEEFLLLLLYAARKAKLTGLLKEEAEVLYSQLASEWHAESKAVAWTLKNLAEGKAGYPILLDQRSAEGLTEKVWRVTSFRSAHKVLTWLATQAGDDESDITGAPTQEEGLGATSSVIDPHASFTVTRSVINLALDTEHDLPQFNVRIIQAPIDIANVSFIEQSKDPKLEVWTELLNWDDVIFFFQSNSESSKRRRLKDITALRFYRHLGNGEFEVLLYTVLRGPVDAAQRNPIQVVQ